MFFPELCTGDVTHRSKHRRRAGALAALGRVPCFSRDDATMPRAGAARDAGGPTSCRLTRSVVAYLAVDTIAPPARRWVSIRRESVGTAERE